MPPRRPPKSDHQELEPRFDWETSPLDEVMVQWSNMKREFDRISAVILRRQSLAKPSWTCWTQFHKDIVPKEVQRLCRRTGPDGRWAFRDDGVFKTVEGLRIPDPVFCCNNYCYEYYQKAKPLASLSRH